LLLHRPSDALRALDDYGAARKTSVLVAEAQLLRVEALLQAGKREAAVRLAERALEQSPNGSHAARLREIVGAR
jgi:prolyl-tRNA editing enzyme YbaK/EbsC (Cys-tRNA(Pro) deacylase)